MQKEAFKWVRHILNRRFNEIDSSLLKRVQELSSEQLEALGDALFDFSQVADLVVWLEQQRH